MDISHDSTNSGISTDPIYLIKLMYPLTEYIGVIPSKIQAIPNSNSTIILQSEEKNHDSEMDNMKSKNVNNDMQNSMNDSLKSDLYLSLFPLYHISKICGLYPVKMKSTGRGLYSGTLHKTTVFYGLLLGVALIASQVWGLWRDFRDGWKNSTRLSTQTALTVTSSDILSVLSVMTSAIFTSPFRWKYLQKTMNILSEVDEKIGTLAVKRFQRITIALISCPLLYLIIVCIFDYQAWKLSFDKRKFQLSADKGPINYVPLYLMNIVITIFEVQYALSILHVANVSKEQENLASVIASDVGNIRPINTKTFDWISSGNDNQSLVDSISTLMTLHGNLCESTTYLNAAFGVTLLVDVLGCIFHLIIASYFLYSEIRKDDFSWDFLMIQSLWVIFHFVRLLIVVQPCYMTILKAKETASLVSQFLTLKWDISVRRRLEIFSLQLLHRPLNFSACGLFSLDRSLITSILGAVTTYLVILVQFQNQDDCTQGARSLKNATDYIFKNISLAKVPKSN